VASLASKSTTMISAAGYSVRKAGMSAATAGASLWAGRMMLTPLIDAFTAGDGGSMPACAPQFRASRQILPLPVRRLFRRGEHETNAVDEYAVVLVRSPRHVHGLIVIHARLIHAIQADQPFGHQKQRHRILGKNIICLKQGGHCIFEPAKPPLIMGLKD